MNKELLIIGFFIGIIIISTMPLVESAIPPTRAFQRVTTSNDTIHSFNSTANLNIVGIGAATITGSNNSKTVYVNVASTAGPMEALTNVTDIGCATGQILSVVGTTWECTTLSGGGNASLLADLGYVTVTSQAYNNILQFNNLGQWVNKLFALNNQTTGAGDAWINGIDNRTGQIRTKIFSVNNQTTGSGDTWINGIDNSTGEIRTKQFSVNTITCSGTDRVSAINNATGEVTCASSGSTAREDLVADWEVDRTFSNIGTVYVDVYNVANANGDAVRIDTNGMATATLQVIWTKVGAGTQACQILQNGGTAVLIQINDIVTGINVNATQTIPVALQNTIFNGKVQCKSTTGTDDPVFLHGTVLLSP